jgi:hypothetical protein
MGDTARSSSASRISGAARARRGTRQGLQGWAATEGRLSGETPTDHTRPGINVARGIRSRHGAESAGHDILGIENGCGSTGKALGAARNACWDEREQTRGEQWRCRAIWQHSAEAEEECEKEWMCHPRHTAGYGADGGQGVFTRRPSLPRSPSTRTCAVSGVRSRSFREAGGRRSLWHSRWGAAVLGP